MDVSLFILRRFLTSFQFLLQKDLLVKTEFQILAKHLEHPHKDKVSYFVYGFN